MRCCVPDAMSPDGPGPGLRRLLVTCLATAACLHALAVVGGALSAARPGPHRDSLCRGKGTRVHGGGGVVCPHAHRLHTHTFTIVWNP